MSQMASELNMNRKKSGVIHTAKDPGKPIRPPPHRTNDWQHIQASAPWARNLPECGGKAKRISTPLTHPVAVPTSRADMVLTTMIALQSSESYVKKQASSVIRSVNMLARLPIMPFSITIYHRMPLSFIPMSSGLITNSRFHTPPSIIPSMNGHAMRMATAFAKFIAITCEDCGAGLHNFSRAFRGVIDII